METIEQIDEVQTAPAGSLDLAICPEEIRMLDPNADILWAKFLRRTGIPMSAKAKKGKNVAKDVWVDNNCRRAAIIRSFGIQSLLQRLAACKTELDRARVWWRESAACAEGDSVPDLSSENMYALNAFIVTKELKFKDTRFEKLATKSWEDVSEQSAQTSAPKVGRKKRRDAKFQTPAEKQAAYRIRQTVAA
jgi:hypothetical protein